MKFGISGLKEVLNQVKSSVKKEHDNQVSSVATKMKAAIVDATPIKTGKAREGWKLEREANGYAVKNDVEYIEHLNAGTSKQAPAHFVEQTALKYGTPKGAIVESN